VRKLISTIFFVAFSFVALLGHAQIAAEPNEAELATHKHYTNKAGQDVHAPAKSKSGKAPTNASAKCRDGSYSLSKHHRGTCSQHGGVAVWMN